MIEVTRALKMNHHSVGPSKNESTPPKPAEAKFCVQSVCMYRIVGGAVLVPSVYNTARGYLEDNVRQIQPTVQLTKDRAKLKSRSYWTMPARTEQPLLSAGDAPDLATWWGISLADSLSLNAHSLHATPVYNSLRVNFEFRAEDQDAPPAIPNEFWVALRETLAIWRAVACCRGYGGLENRAFWDAVMQVLVAITGFKEAELRSPLERKGQEKNSDAFHVTLRISSSIDAWTRDAAELVAFQVELVRQLAALNRATPDSESANFKRSWRRVEDFIDPARASKLNVSIPVTIELNNVPPGSCEPF